MKDKIKNKIREILRRLRNVFTGEMEKELSDLSIKYFALHDKYEELVEEVEQLAVN
jgi:predicted nuclease with TOPRIM domain